MKVFKIDPVIRSSTEQNFVFKKFDAQFNTTDSVNFNLF